MSYHQRLASVKPVLNAALRWHAELRETERTDVLIMDPQDEVVFALGPGQVKPNVIGVIVFREEEDEPVFWINLTYVDPVWRGKGVFTDLWDQLVQIARERGIHSIQGGTHVDNHGMKEVMRKVGQKPWYIVYNYEVPNAERSV